jgi:hypothetical protein
MLVAVLVCACPGPDCPAICQRCLSCDVTFTPADDPNLRQVESGERSPQQSCELGCRESLSVDATTEACVLAVEATEPAACREQILSCLGRADTGN